MADQDVKFKHFKHRTRNLMAKALRDPSERKGAFALKINDDRKQKYKRKRVRVNSIEQDSN